MTLSGEPLSQPEGLVFTARQREFYDILRTRDARLADMYHGSLDVLSQISNPDRIPQSAHSMRELIEKLPRYLGLVVQKDPTPLKRRTSDLADDFGKIQISTDGTSESVLVPKKFVDRLQRYFDDYHSDFPNRREVGKSVINSLDPSGRTLPGVVLAERAKDWLYFIDYFNNVSHHRFPQSDAQYSEKVQNFEDFLLNFLRPRTADSQFEIQELIDEGEGRDHGDT